MLSKENCIQAINNWEITKSNYTEIEKLIYPAAAFNFSQEDCQWIKDNNNNSEFHIYIGDYNNQLILIVVPLDKNGKEVDLAAYLTSTLTNLNSDLILVETNVVTTTKTTTFSENLAVTNYSEQVELPICNEPTIMSRASVDDIEKWKDECLDWLYSECNDFNGQRIFRTFTVPFPDLVIEDEKYNEVKALFGFKFSSIYQRSIAVLIFVAAHTDTSYAEIIRLSMFSTDTDTNTKDWSQPCPPMCRELKDFNLI